jgi:hypothetical protein
MQSPFPGMDPFLEKNPIFNELHTQMLAKAQVLLQPQLRPKYVAKLERHLSEGSVWGLEVGVQSLERKEPDIAIVRGSRSGRPMRATALLSPPTASEFEELAEEELALRKQRRITIYVQSRPRLAVTSIELLSPSNKESGTVGQARYLEKRSSALHGGLHWVEIDLLRGGERPPIPVRVPASDYLAYVAQATPSGWHHQLYTWTIREPLPTVPIPLLGDDRAVLDLAACFRETYDAVAADDEAGYDGGPPAPALKPKDRIWVDRLLHKHGLRR